MPPPALDPLAPEEDVPWYEREFMDRAKHEMEIEGPVQGCELPGILKLFFDPDHRWQFEGGHLFLEPHQIEQLTPWLNLRMLSPEEVQASRAARTAPIPPLMPSIDESVPLTEMLAQLLESMQPGFRKRLPWAFVCFVFPAGWLFFFATHLRLKPFLSCLKAM